VHGNIYRNGQGERRCVIPDAGLTIVPAGSGTKVYRSDWLEEDKLGSHVGNVDVSSELVEAAEQYLAAQERVLEIWQGDERLHGMIRDQAA